MSSARKKLRLSTVAVSLGCNCRRPKLWSVLSPKPIGRPNKLNPSSSLSTGSSATSTFSSSASSQVSSEGRRVGGFGRVGGQSVAVEKESDDPYLDFRHSMLQMILEKQIYAKDDLKQLLNCFLQLNSPYYHAVIVRAFTEIWNGVYSVNSPPNRTHYYT